MRTGVNVVSRCLCMLTVLLVLAAVPLPGLAQDADVDKPLESAVDDSFRDLAASGPPLDPAGSGQSPNLESGDPVPTVGWRIAEVPAQGHTRLLFNSGLMWSCDYVLEYIGTGDASAVARVNAGHVIPGDTVIEYLICSYRTGSAVDELIYGQVWYAGCDAAGIRLSERFCNVPTIAGEGSGLASAGDIGWHALRALIDAVRPVRAHTYVFPLEHRSIAFGPTGHLGLSITISEAREMGAVIQLLLPLSQDFAQAAEFFDWQEEILTHTSAEIEHGGEPPDRTGGDVSDEFEPWPELSDVSEEEPEAGPPEEAGAALTPFSSPESTAKFFLEAVMVERDPVKAAQAWSPRIPQVVIKAVVNNEIEFFADRDSALLSSLLSSLEYVAQPVSETEAIVSVIEYDDEAVVGRLELFEGDWLLIALGYQLDSDLNLSAEWKRLAGLE